MNRQQTMKIAQALDAARRHAATAPELVAELAREALEGFVLAETLVGDERIRTEFSPRRDGTSWATTWERDDNLVDGEDSRDAVSALARHEFMVEKAANREEV